MPRIKLFIACLSIFFSGTVYSQSNNTVLMKWKLKPGETISYKAYIKLDTAASDKTPFANFFKGFGLDSVSNAKNEKSKAGKGKGRASNKEGMEGFRGMMQQLQKLEPEYYVTHLKETKAGIIDVDMTPYKPQTAVDSAKKKEGFLQMMSAMSSGPMLEGAIREDGSVYSFYLGSEQKNILALFFQLPTKPVKLNDTLEIATNFINVGRGFKCDDFYKKNKVWIADILETPTDKVVTIKYDIEEYAAGGYDFPFPQEEKDKYRNQLTTVFKTAFKGTAKFSTVQGRWLNYDGELETSNTGMMGGGHSKKWYRLIAQ